MKSRDTRGMPYKDAHWSDAPVSQEMPKIASKPTVASKSNE